MIETTQYQIREGSRFPRGVTVCPDGVNFSLLSRGATGIELRLYDAVDSEAPFQVIELDPQVNRTFIIWHVFVEALPEGIWYTWRAWGPQSDGQRFDPNKELLDPWATAVSDRLWDRWADGSGHSARSMRAMVVDHQRPLQQSIDERCEGDFDDMIYRAEEAVIYELHVGGFTRHPSSGVDDARRGTFLGLIDKIPYIKALGVTHVELLPVMAFDEDDVPPAVAARGLRNYWGYSPHSFYSPHPGYCVRPDRGEHVREFREMVQAFHAADLEVILDVVINHTAEGGADGPTINFKGLGNEIFYQVDPEHGYSYRDYTGCGNTINANQPLVSAFLLDCLEFWATEVGVDGFRFDLASVLCRDVNGEPMENPPIVWSIELSPLLARKRIIAEAWDAAGLYQVGHFPGYRWSEWNGRYRDVMRRFVRGDRGLIAEVSTRIGGSSDYYQPADRHPFNSVNFITCHDGFTLWDLVSYNRKHNEANGENNRDGHNDNLSWNCGTEGETTDPGTLALRRKQARNFMAVLMLSQGNPMILAGDEVLRSQRGNNNAWCQNNALGWFDWGLVEKNADMLRFTREMIALRRRHPALMRRQFLTGNELALTGIPDICWYSPDLQPPEWDDPVAQVLAFTLSAIRPDEAHLHVILNMSDLNTVAAIPDLPNVDWRLVVDTARPAPKDIVPPDQAVRLTADTCDVSERSIVVLEGDWQPIS